MPRTGRRALLVTAVAAAALSACSLVLGIPGDIDPSPARAGGDGAAPPLEAGMEGAVPPGASPDGGDGGDGSSEPDADAGDPGCPPAACDLDAGFGTPVRLETVSSARDDLHPRLSEDERTLVFASNRGGASFDVYTAQRACWRDAFGPAVRVEGVSSADDEYAPVLSSDGSRLWFERQSLVTFDSNILVGVRDLDGGVDGAVPVPGLNDVRASVYDAQPFVRGDGSVLFFVGYEDSSLELFEATRQPGGGYTSQKVLGGVNTRQHHEHDPVVSRDRLELFFARSPSAARARATATCGKPAGRRPRRPSASRPRSPG